MTACTSRALVCAISLNSSAALDAGVQDLFSSDGDTPSAPVDDSPVEAALLSDPGGVPPRAYDALEAELRAHAELHLSQTALLQTPLGEFGASVEEQCVTVDECTSLLAQLRAQMAGLAHDGVRDSRIMFV